MAAAPDGWGQDPPPSGALTAGSPRSPPPASSSSPPAPAVPAAAPAGRPRLLASRSSLSFPPSSSEASNSQSLPARSAPSKARTSPTPRQMRSTGDRLRRRGDGDRLRRRGDGERRSRRPRRGEAARPRSAPEMQAPDAPPPPPEERAARARAARSARRLGRNAAGAVAQGLEGPGLVSSGDVSPPRAANVSENGMPLPRTTNESGNGMPPPRATSVSGNGMPLPRIAKASGDDGSFGARSRSRIGKGAGRCDEPPGEPGKRPYPIRSEIERARYADEGNSASDAQKRRKNGADGSRHAAEKRQGDSVLSEERGLREANHKAAQDTRKEDEKPEWLRKQHETEQESGSGKRSRKQQTCGRSTFQHPPCGPARRSKASERFEGKEKGGKKKKTSANLSQTSFGRGCGHLKSPQSMP